MLPNPWRSKDAKGRMTTGRLFLALTLLIAAPLAGNGTADQHDVPETAGAGGCLPAGSEMDAAMPGEIDLADGISYYGFLRTCVQGRPPVVTIDLAQYFKGQDAVREAARDGQYLEAEIDPVTYVRNRNVKLRHLGVKLDAQVLMFDCTVPGCPPIPVHLNELPWNELYRFRLQNGLIVYMELPYSP